MASFFSKLFGGGKKNNPIPKAATPNKDEPVRKGRGYRPGKRSKTVHTGALGISVADRSKANLKSLTGE